MSKIKDLLAEVEDIDDLKVIANDEVKELSIRAKMLDKVVKNMSDVRESMWLTAIYDYDDEGHTVISNIDDIYESFAILAFDAIMEGKGDDISDAEYSNIIKGSIKDIKRLLSDEYDQLIAESNEDANEKFNERVERTREVIFGHNDN